MAATDKKMPISAATSDAQVPHHSQRTGIWTYSCRITEEQAIQEIRLAQYTFFHPQNQASSEIGNIELESKALQKKLIHSCSS